MITIEGLRQAGKEHLQAKELLTMDKYDYIDQTCDLDRNGKPCQKSVTKIIKKMFKDIKIDKEVILYEFYLQYEREEGKYPSFQFSWD